MVGVANGPVLRTYSGCMYYIDGSCRPKLLARPRVDPPSQGAVAEAGATEAARCAPKLGVSAAHLPRRAGTSRYIRRIYIRST